MNTQLIEFTLYSSAGTIAPNLSGIKYAFFEQTNPASLTAPVASGSGETTDSAGLFSLTLSTNLTTGNYGWLLLSNSDGTITQNPPAQAFSGVIQLQAVGGGVVADDPLQLYDSASFGLQDIDGAYLLCTG